MQFNPKTTPKEKTHELIDQLLTLVEGKIYDVSIISLFYSFIILPSRSSFRLYLEVTLQEFSKLYSSAVQESIERKYSKS